MIYFELNQILNALLAFAAFGFIVGLSYNSMYISFRFLKDMILTLYKEFKYSRSSFLKENKNIIRKNLKCEKNHVIANIFDFFVFILGGIIYILCQYIYFDGVFRIYNLTVFLLSGYLSHIIFGNLIINILNLLYEKILILWHCIIKIIVFPISFIYIKLFKPLVLKIITLVQNAQFFSSKKVNEIKKKQKNI